jgi:flagellar basal-body rod modification protein FlgD
MIPTVSTAPAMPVQTDAARGTLAENFDSFLRLLTTQLQNQDPLQPLDATQFTGQLVQFAGVEQAINTNTRLDALIAENTASRRIFATRYIGHTVEAQGNRAMLRDGPVAYRYTLPSDAARTVVTVSDAQGRVVLTAPGATASGSHGFAWDGRDDSGVLQPPGIYAIGVFARDAEDRPIPVETAISGRVAGIHVAEGTMTLDVEGVMVPFSDVLAVR